MMSLENGKKVALRIVVNAEINCKSSVKLSAPVSYEDDFFKTNAGRVSCYMDEDDKIIVNKHTLTEYTAYTLYGIYHIVMVAIMLNMLIAMMSNTLSRIQVGCHAQRHDVQHVVKDTGRLSWLPTCSSP